MIVPVSEIYRVIYKPIIANSLDRSRNTGAFLKIGDF